MQFLHKSVYYSCKIITIKYDDFLTVLSNGRQYIIHKYVYFLHLSRKKIYTTFT